MMDLNQSGFIRGGGGFGLIDSPSNTLSTMHQMQSEFEFVCLMEGQCLLPVYVALICHLTTSPSTELHPEFRAANCELDTQICMF